MTALVHDIATSASRWPEKPAVINDGTTTSYSKLEFYVNGIATWLAMVGTGPSDIVTIWLPAMRFTLSNAPVRSLTQCRTELVAATQWNF
jgi:non-ribosomal peptide synthetase component E (peptide arylation enzyme)